MKAFIKKLSMLLAVGAVTFGSGLLNKDTNVASAAALSGEYTKITDISTLADNDQVVLYNDTTEEGVTGWNGNKDATVSLIKADWTIFTVTVVDGGVNLYDSVASKYIASPGSSNQFKYGTAGVCSVNENGALECNGRYLLNNQGKYYRMYATIYDDASTFDVYKYVKQEATADSVIALINAIGTVEYTELCKAAIDEARAAYEELTPELQATVSNYSVLTDAETTYANLVVAYDKEQALYVDTLIDSIGEVVDFSKNSLIAEARAEYDNLTDTQKGYVTKLAILEAAEDEIAKYTPKIGSSTFDFTSVSASDVATNGYVVGEISLAHEKGTASTDPNASYNPIRFYQNSILTITASSNVKAISKITVNANNAAYATVWTTSTYNIGVTSEVTDKVAVIEMIDETNEITIKFSAQTRIHSLVVEYYEAEKVDNLQALIDLINSLDTCTDYDQAATLREMYNALTEEEKAIFDATEVGGYTLAHKLAYMEQLAAASTESSNANTNLFTSLGNNNVSYVLIIGVLGLVAIAAYYFLNKKKVSC